ncbi:MAG: hypothetical protein RL148_1056 [Planctomycetota bacterium]|jgi:hypothetical protein
MKSNALAGLAFGLVAALAACSSAPEEAPPSGGGLGVAAIQFQDVVVPDGLTMIERFNESYSIEEAGYRQARFEYSGQTRVEDASSHLLQRMPQHAWTLSSDEQVDKATRKLKFIRGRYIAEYTLVRKDGITTMRVDYRTDIDTK